MNPQRIGLVGYGEVGKTFTSGLKPNAMRARLAKITQ